VTLTATIDREALTRGPSTPVSLRVIVGGQTIGQFTLVMVTWPPTPTQTPLPRGCVPINWALQAYGGRVISRTTAAEENEATFVNDDASTYWLTAEDQPRSQAVVIDLGEVRTVNQIAYLANLLGQPDASRLRPARLLVELSLDDDAYVIVPPDRTPPTPTPTSTGTAGPVPATATPTPILETMRGGGPAGMVTLDRSRQARFVRVTILDNQGGPRTGLDEIQVIELCGAARPTASPAPSATPEATSTAMPTLVLPLTNTPWPRRAATAASEPTPDPTSTVTDFSRRQPSALGPPGHQHPGRPRRACQRPCRRP
jgi:hypothetical protein